MTWRQQGLRLKAQWVATKGIEKVNWCQQAIMMSDLLSPNLPLIADQLERKKLRYATSIPRALILSQQSKLSKLLVLQSVAFTENRTV